MAAKIELAAEVRKDMGKRASRRFRRLENKVLATIYGANKDNAPILLDHNKVNKALENEAFYSSILTLNIAGQPEKVVIKAIQRHPSQPKIVHMDFFRINMKEKLSMHIPLHFSGDESAPGVKMGGGVVSHLLNEVEVRCLPADLPEFIAVDLSHLEMNQAVHLSELKLPEGVELVALMHEEANDQAVANVHMPHVIEEVTEEVPVSPEVEATRVPSAKAGEEAPAGGGSGKKDKADKA